MNNDKILCKKCGNRYHPKIYSMCWSCWSTQPTNTLKHFKKEVKEYDGYEDYEPWIASEEH
jgi:NMD protein affecting ribosome stability and mRNA decay